MSKDKDEDEDDPGHDPFTLDEAAITAAFRDAALVPPRQWLAHGGYVPVRPEEMPDGHLSGRMWELLYALAARRFFFGGGDSLSDAELYARVFAWLDGPQRDIAWDQGWNCLHDLDSDTETWGNPWFDDESHEQWHREFPCVVMPVETREIPGARMLPVPPRPPVPVDWPAFENEDDDEIGDPLGLAEVDREIAGEPPAPPPGMRENWQRPADQMQDTGYTPVPPDELTEDTVAPLLWEFIHQLAIRSFFVTHTDHLDDDALYRELWGKAIREDSLMPGRRSGTGYWMHDIIGSYGDEEIQLELACYATDEKRAKHTRDYPSIPLPPKRERIVHRDWRLPKPSF